MRTNRHRMPGHHGHRLRQGTGQMHTDIHGRRSNRTCSLMPGLSGNPFREVYTGVDKTIKRAISLAGIRSIKKLDLSARPDLCLARDIFLFSFYTRGMSFVDICFLKKKCLRHGTLYYIRNLLARDKNHALNAPECLFSPKSCTSPTIVPTRLCQFLISKIQNKRQV